MGLAHLPVELLCSIWSTLDSYEIAGRRSLVKTCRQFHRVFQPLFYRYAVEHYCAAASHWAGKHGRIDTLKCLMAEGGDKIIHDRETTPLFFAAEHGQAVMVRFLIARGVDFKMEPLWNSPDRPSNALTLAARNGHKATVELFLDAGVEIDWMGELGTTALSAAAESGQNDMVLFLYKRGADITRQDHWQQTALCTAAGMCSAAVVERLLENYPYQLPRELWERRDGDGMTLLSFAAECGNVDVIKLLLERGVDITGLGADDTPLRVAIRENQTEAVRFLLDAGACPNDSQTPRQYAPLPLAAECGHDEAVQMLLEKGADVHYVLPWRETPLGLAAGRGHCDVVKTLVKAGVALDQRNRHGDTALQLALASNKEEVALLLVELGARPSMLLLEMKQELLLLAARENMHELVMSLLEEIGYIDSCDGYGVTALMAAVMKDREELAMVLLQKGADPCFQDSFGRTSLAIAAERGSLRVLLIILEYGTPQPRPPMMDIPWIDIPDKKGRTPLFYATVNGHQQVIATLLARGSAAANLPTSAGRTPCYVADQWTFHPDREISNGDTVTAIQRLFKDPSTTIISPGAVLRTGLVPVQCPRNRSLGELANISLADFKCRDCFAVINEYGERHFCPICEGNPDVHSDQSLCPECFTSEARCGRYANHVLQRQPEWQRHSC